MTLDYAAIDENPATQPLPRLAAFPNPFRASATVSFELKRASLVQASIYDAGGQLVSSLPGMLQSPGVNTLVWNAEGCEPGVYLVKLNLGSETRSLRIVKAN